jgi:chromate transport protein ChrA
LIDRQKLVGWVLVVGASLYMVHFLHDRLFEPGPPLVGKEWFRFISAIVIVMLGTANLRLAAMREQKQKRGSD